MVLDFFADLTEVKENLIKTWFLVGYGEEKKKKKSKKKKRKGEFMLTNSMCRRIKIIK